MRSDYDDVVDRVKADIEEMERLATDYQSRPIAPTRDAQEQENEELAPVREKLQLYHFLLKGMRLIPFPQKDLEDLKALDERANEIGRFFMSRAFAYFHQERSQNK